MASKAASSRRAAHRTRHVDTLSVHTACTQNVRCTHKRRLHARCMCMCMSACATHTRARGCPYRRRAAHSRRHPCRASLRSRRRPGTGGSRSRPTRTTLPATCWACSCSPRLPRCVDEPSLQPYVTGAAITCDRDRGYGAFTLGSNRVWQVKKPCDDRFCVDPANPVGRWGDGRRDADDPHASAAAGSRAARAARAARGALGLGLLVCSLLLGAAGQARAARPPHVRRRSVACA